MFGEIVIKNLINVLYQCFVGCVVVDFEVMGWINVIFFGVVNYDYFGIIFVNVIFNFLESIDICQVMMVKVEFVDFYSDYFVIDVGDLLVYLMIVGFVLGWVFNDLVLILIFKIGEEVKVVVEFLDIFFIYIFIIVVVFVVEGDIVIFIFIFNEVFIEVVIVNYVIGIGIVGIGDYVFFFGLVIFVVG